MNYDLTTAKGRKEAGKYLAPLLGVVGAANVAVAAASAGAVGTMAATGMLIPPVGIGLAVAGLVSLLSQKDIISAQKELAENLIKTGKENGVDDMEITVDNKVGMNFGATFDGVPVNAMLGSNGKMTLKVKFK